MGGNESTFGSNLKISASLPIWSMKMIPDSPQQKQNKAKTFIFPKDLIDHT